MRLGIGIVLVAAATGFLVWRATGDNLTYYREVDELLAAPEAATGPIRISGEVVDGTIARDEATRTLAFSIKDLGAAEPARRIPVLYEGPTPDIFRAGIQVVVEGTMRPDGTFEAETLLAKCPSKYQAAGELEAAPAPRS